jgi:hypothetical protein
MKVYNKMKWALGILLVFIIVLITNLYSIWIRNSGIKVNCCPL